MLDVLLVTDADWIANECESVFDGQYKMARIRRGVDALSAIESKDPRLLVLDMQVGSMGGMATCMAVRQEEQMGRLQRRPVLMLLDRAADEFLARRSAADAWLIKPINALRLARIAYDLIS